MNLRKETDDAVSPVVGVMLMVVVTAVIAAVIVAFSTGLATDTAGTGPVAMIDIGKIELTQGVFGLKIDSIEFIHKGGDPLLIDDIEISMVDNAQSIYNFYGGTALISRGPGEPPTPCITVYGKSGTGIVINPGDIIKLTLPYTENHAYYAYSDLTWSLYSHRTDTVIAEGVFTIPPEEI